MSFSAKAPKRIDRLTEMQQARLAPFADEWIARGLSTEVSDWATFQRAAANCYRLAGLRWHGRVVRVSNPLIGALTSLIASKLLREKTAVHDAVGDAVHGAVRDAVGGAVHGAVRDAVDDAVHGAVDDAVGDIIRGIDPSAWGRGLVGGAWWIAWVSWREFFFSECGLALGEAIEAKRAAYRDASTASGWWWAYDSFVVVCDRPRVIHRQQVAPRGWGSHRLHCRSGPAIAWRDGWSLWFLEGVQVTRQVVEFPETITAEAISQESNAERRRLMMRQFGPTAGVRDDDYDGTLHYLRAVGSKLIDADGGTRAIGSAPRCLVEIADKEWPRWLVLTDGSTKRVYTIPANAESATVADAVKRVNGGIPDDALYAES